MSDQGVVLEVRDLKTHFKTPRGVSRAVDGVSFTIRKGEVFAVVGESGCGKSVTALSIMQILPQPAGYIAGGSILFHGRDIVTLPEPEKRAIRGSGISMIFQEPQTSLNPVFTIGSQLAEVFKAHQHLGAEAIRAKALAMLKLVGISDPEQRLKDYPHQLSGGMKQRVMIAMALGCEPDVLIADEPTTALDVTIQAQVLNLMDDLRTKLNTAILLITHDLGVVRQIAHRVAVMYLGRIVETAPVDELFRNPRHPYTRQLLQSLPSRMQRGARLSVIPGTVPSAINVPPGCPFADRCFAAQADCRVTFPPLQAAGADHSVACLHPAAPMPGRVSVAGTGAAGTKGSDLVTAGLQVFFPVRRGIFRRVVGHVRAVDGVDLTVGKGRSVALVGESGCGKTTLGKAVMGLERIHGGSIRYGIEELGGLRGDALRAMRRRIQIVFQDPFAALNPRMMVEEIVGEGLKVHRLTRGRDAYRARVGELLEMVGLTRDVVNRYPHEFSGGQRQRICIARALAVAPELIICDEATSALDVSVQAQILNLLRELQERLNLAYLFITHNLSLVEYFSDYMFVMYLGEIVEEGPVEAIFTQPRHPYTDALMKAVPQVDTRTGISKIRLEGDVPSPMNPPSGCRFHTRCLLAQARCRTEHPGLEAQAGRSCRCWFPLEPSGPPARL
ncbi:MAG: dipeptide ABC transporter ATP-binding protein [Planctomycetota bacterium]